jgi:hypothetical protein
MSQNEHVESLKEEEQGWGAKKTRFFEDFCSFFAYNSVAIALK